jgi:hypothetical protein
MKTPDIVLIKALFMLARDIESEDGVANACIQEGAHRIAELTAGIREVLLENLHLADGENCTLAKLKKLINFELPKDED